MQSYLVSLVLLCSLLIGSTVAAVCPINEAQLSQAVADGDAQFNCLSKVTITITAPLQITQDITIDGGTYLSIKYVS